MDLRNIAARRFQIVSKDTGTVLYAELTAGEAIMLLRAATGLQITDAAGTEYFPVLRGDGREVLVSVPGDAREVEARR